MIVALYVPGVTELYEHVATVVPEGEMFAVEGQDIVSAEGEETLRFIAPERPARLVRVTVALVVGAVNETGCAEMLKSTRVTERTTE